MNFKSKVEVYAKFMLIVRKSKTKAIVSKTPWSNNLVLNTGLNRMSQGVWIDRCCVGSGNSPPIATQTKLDNILAATTTITTTTNGVNFTNAPLYSWTRLTWQFGEGVAQGNISEVGMGWTEGSGLQNHQLWNRALIKDLNGNPTTISVFEDEYLEVISEIRMHFNQSFTGSFNMVDKYGAVVNSYTYSGIPYMREGYPNFNVVKIASIQIYSGFKQDLVTLPNNNVFSSGNDTPIINTHPSARSVQAKIKIPLVYGNGGLHRTFAVFFTGMLSANSLSAYQVEINPPITKTSNDILEYTFTLTWDRYTV